MTEPVQLPQSNRKQLFEKYKLSIGIVVGFCPVSHARVISPGL